MKRIASNLRRTPACLNMFLLALGVLLCQSARATLVFYEPFSATIFPENTRLGNSPVGQWTLGNGTNSSGIAASIVSNAAAMTYSGLVSSNGSRGLARVANTTASNRQAGALLSSTVTSGSAYCSFLLNVVTAPTVNRALITLSSATSSTPNFGAAVWMNSSRQLLVAKNNSSAPGSSATATALDLSTTNLIVYRYKYNSSTSTDDEIALWINPASGTFGNGSEPGSPDLTFATGTDVTTLLAVYCVQGQGSGAGTGSAYGSYSGLLHMDEIRVGTTWADVTPPDCVAPGTFSVTGGGAYCSGGSGVSVGLSGSESGIDYYLKRNGVTVAGPTPGTTSALDFGLQTLAGTYTVVGSNTTTTCVGTMSGTAIVTVNTAPAITGGASNAVACVGVTANFTVTATGAGLTYQWQVNTGSGFGDVTTGTGGTTASYTTATLSGGDNNSQYRCIVSGTCPPSATSGTGTLTVSSGANINSNPTDKTVSTTSTATFTVGASGPSLTYQWQFSIDSGATYNPVTTGTGGTTASYTTAALALSDSGTKYKCVVSAACGSPAESTSATVTVLDATYRSAASGVWTVPATWEQSYDGGANWAPGTTYPTDANTTNITVRNGHTVTATNALSVDDLTVAAGGEVDASAATLTIADGSAAVDCDVSGTIQVASAAGSGFAVTAGAGLKFENGGRFVWNGATTVAIPTATWADGSTCEVQNGTTTTPTGLGQSFYDFYWNKTSAGAVNLGGTLTTVRHNLRMRGSSDSANSVRFMAVTSTVDLRVGNDVILEGGFTTLSGGSQINTVLNIHVGANFTINSGATLDSRTSGLGSFANILFTNASTAQTFSNAGAISHTGTGGGCPINWKVLGGVTVNMVGGNIAMATANNSTRDSVTVDGTLNLLTNQLTGAGSLAITGTLGGNGTNQLTSGLNSTTYGGTLNLGTLPALVDSQYFKLFDSVSYGGSFASILPSPSPLNWDATQLAVDGTLRATSGSVFNPNPTSIAYSVSGSTLTLSWPNDHTGWLLQSNSVDVGNASLWFTIAGADTTNQVFITIDPARPNVYFRMLKP